MVRRKDYSKKPTFKLYSEELFQRPKMGFGIPIDKWIREDLRDWAGDLLTKRREFFWLKLVFKTNLRKQFAGIPPEKKNGTIICGEFSCFSKTNKIIIKTELGKNG